MAEEIMSGVYIKYLINALCVILHIAAENCRLSSCICSTDVEQCSQLILMWFNA